MLTVNKALLFLIFLIFPLGQLIRIQFPFLPPEIRIQPIDLFVFLFSLNWIFSKRKEWKFQLFSKEILVFLGLALFSLLIKARTLSLKHFFIAFLYFARLVNYFIFYFSFSDYLKKHKDFFLNKYLIYEGILVAVFSVIQYIFLPDVRFLYYLGWDDHYFRAIGTFLDPGFNGLILVLSFLTVVDKFLTIDGGKWKIGVENRKLIGVGLLILTAVVLTFSRTSYLVLALGLIVFFVFKRNFKILISILCLFTILIIVSPKPSGEGVDLLRKSTIFARFDNYGQLFSIVKDNFLFGVGFNALRPAFYKYGYLSEENWETSNAGAGADNSFLFVLATTGIIGLITYLLLLSSIIKKSIKEINKNQFSLLTLVSFVSICTASFFINGLFYPWIVLWLMALLAQFTAGIEE